MYCTQARDRTQANDMRNTQVYFAAAAGGLHTLNTQYDAEIPQSHSATITSADALIVPSIFTRTRHARERSNTAQSTSRRTRQRTITSIADWSNW